MLKLQTCDVKAPQHDHAPQAYSTSASVLRCSSALCDVIHDCCRAHAALHLAPVRIACCAVLAPSFPLLHSYSAVTFCSSSVWARSLESSSCGGKMAMSDALRSRGAMPASDLPGGRTATGEDTLQALDLTEARDCILHVVLSVPLRSDDPKDFVRETTEQNKQGNMLWWVRRSVLCRRCIKSEELLKAGAPAGRIYQALRR